MLTIKLIFMMRGLVEVTLNALGPASEPANVYARAGADQLTRRMALTMCRALETVAPASVEASHMTAIAAQLSQGLMREVLESLEEGSGDGEATSRHPFTDIPAYAQLAIALMARPNASSPPRADYLMGADWLMGAYLAFESAHQYLEDVATGGEWFAAIDIPQFLASHPRIASSLAVHLAWDMSKLDAEMGTLDDESDHSPDIVLPVVRVLYTVPGASTAALRRALGERLVPSELVDLVRGLIMVQEPRCHDALVIVLTYMLRGTDEVAITLLRRGVVEYFALAYTLDEGDPDCPRGPLRLVIDLARRPGLRELVRGRLRNLIPSLMMSRMVMEDDLAATGIADVIDLARAFELPDPTLARNRRKCSFVDCTRTSPPMACAGCGFARFCNRDCQVAYVVLRC